MAIILPRASRASREPNARCTGSTRVPSSSCSRPGLCLYLPSLAEAVGRRPLLKDIHVYTALAWIAALALIVLAGDRRRLLATAREIDRFDDDDIAWLKAGGAPQGRFNAGQKINAIVTAALAVLFAITGFFLWYGERDHTFRLRNALLVHDWLMYVVAVPPARPPLPLARSIRARATR